MSTAKPKQNYLIPTVIVQAFCLLMVVPLIWELSQAILYDASARRLVHESGEVSERLILFTLLCTPLFLIFGWSLPVRYRRTLGVYSFIALTVHILGQMQTHGYLLRTLFENISMTIGSVALIIMTALTATSFDAIQHAMGKAWKRLHYGVYAVAVLMEAHVVYLEYPRLNLRGIVFGVLVLIILAVRLPIIRNWLQSRRQRKVS